MNDISEKTATTKPPTDSTLVLRAEGLQYSYGVRVKAVDNVSLEVAAGEFVAVHGPSGCGKSTLLFLLGGLLEPDAGSVHVAGSQLTGIPPNARARLRGERIGFVFQRFHLIPYLSVRDNVLAAGLALGSGRGKEGDHTPDPASRPPQRTDRANDLLARLGLAERASHLPSELSVGEQQRTALARALFLEPPLLLADEPTGNLDPENRDRLLAELKACAASGQAVVMVSHDEVAIAAASRRLPMVDGRWV